MTLWMVRAGSHGEREAIALEKGLVAIGWEDLPDLSTIKNKEELEKIYWETYPDSKKMEAANQVGQIWRFVHEIQISDFVALPLKTQSAIAIGEITGSYECSGLAENIKHIRKVKWLKTIPRTAFNQDLLYSFGAFMTVCQIKRNNAEERVVKILKGKTLESAPTEAIFDEAEPIDIEMYAKDEITKIINSKFKGHGLARLVDAVLIAQGYTTQVSPPGPDGGVDILASAGSLGFDNPRICVQVKSSSSQVDVRILRELRGVMSRVRAEQGLLVAWGGFNSKVVQEAKDDFFCIRLWDSGELLEAFFKYYEKFDEDLKAELPLKKIWALVLEEE